MTDSRYEIVADFKPTGDQPEAIATLMEGLRSGKRYQSLEGVTGSGKTFTMANVIADWGKPALVISHNKTLAAQLYSELKSFLPNSAVSYFVSYFDYYQPEAYIPRTDTFIEKDSSINEDVERLRLAATDSLLNRKDVVIVASVSCIYGLGSPENYRAMLVNARVGEEQERNALLEALVDTLYNRNELEKARGTFRVRGDTVEIYPPYLEEEGYRIGFFGDEVESIDRIDTLTGKSLEKMEQVSISPARHFVTPYRAIEQAIQLIELEMEDQVKVFEKNNKLLEAQRIKMRTEYDLEMLREIGFCNGIENYSRFLTGRQAGDRPYTLIDFFDGDFLTIIDESHATIPQLRGMYNGDMARKSVLVEHGFRLPSALDNRPMNFEEFSEVTAETIFVSATPGDFERQVAGEPVKQLIRPTGIIDPEIELRPLANQIDDLMEEIRARAEKGERTLVTTLTKRTAEDLSEYLRSVNLRVKYLHSEIDTIERVELLRSLRQGNFDCLVGINLLREGLDLPEVTLVAILDADKEGFLRSRTSLIQTAGRAARNIGGKVILYADGMTDSMQGLIDVTADRRERQLNYNRAHGITPTTIIKEIQDSLYDREKEPDEEELLRVAESSKPARIEELIRELEEEMLEASKLLEFERAAMIRDQVMELKVAVDPSGGEKPGKGGLKYPQSKRKKKHAKRK